MDTWLWRISLKHCGTINGKNRHSTSIIDITAINNITVVIWGVSSTDHMLSSEIWLKSLLLHLASVELLIRESETKLKQSAGSSHLYSFALLSAYNYISFSHLEDPNLESVGKYLPELSTGLSVQLNHDLHPAFSIWIAIASSDCLSTLMIDDD